MGNTEINCNNICEIKEQPELKINIASKNQQHQKTNDTFLQPLQPILFPKHEQDQHSVIQEQGAVKNINMIHKQQMFQSRLNISPDRQEVLNLNNVKNYNPDDEDQSEGGEVVDAPFAIIKLNLSADLLDTLQTLGQEIMMKYQDKKAELSSKWKLHSHGFYINNIDKGYTAIFTPTSYYQGEIISQFGKLLPNGQGILLTGDSQYKGSFKKGWADGNGKYTLKSNKTVFKGRWSEGMLVNGTIECDQFKYVGDFLNGIAEKSGQIRFKVNPSTYKGQFKDGKFDGRGEFDCVDYSYNGQFRMGKRHGEGELIQKQRNTIRSSRDRQLRKAAYRPELHQIGNWNMDQYEGESSELKNQSKINQSNFKR